MGTGISIQSKGFGSNCRRLTGAFCFLRSVLDTFTSAKTKSVHPPNSSKILKDKAAFLRSPLMSLRCSTIAMSSADIKEEDSRCKSLIPKVSNTSGVSCVGNRARTHFDNLSKAWPSKSTGVFFRQINNDYKYRKRT